MASRDLKDLVPEAREKAERVTRACHDAAGFDLLIYCTLRTLEEQARLYRQSRSRAEVEQKMASFHRQGFGFLANVLESVGPCYGKHVTNAAPGESWHNYAEAWDAVPLIGGKAAWNYLEAKDHWDAYGEAVRQVGMSWAGDWTTFREYPHAQLRIGGNPLKTLSPEAVRETLIKNKLIDANLF
ncbi:M15 family metallopeptidase [Bowmanella dokdonensis]|uniref:M15 family metallopeptidase n=1 Tax=Bowmanella dokdonensis TaxID=751969 RepID=A0A939DS58_9ALTE|nr:M15 family metallopeptidase [Bowmanella dokdonensis]MBN7826916.1 M15 family metallopeptidase [Bowmanella dokdonensis]